MAYDNRPAAAALESARSAFVAPHIEFAADGNAAASLAIRFERAGLGGPDALAGTLGAMLSAARAAMTPPPPAKPPAKGKRRGFDPCPAEAAEIAARNAAMARLAEREAAARIRLETFRAERLAAWYATALAYAWEASRPRPAEPFKLETGHYAALGACGAMLAAVLAFVAFVVLAIIA